MVVEIRFPKVKLPFLGISPTIPFHFLYIMLGFLPVRRVLLNAMPMGNHLDEDIPPQQRNAPVEGQDIEGRHQNPERFAFGNKKKPGSSLKTQQN